MQKERRQKKVRRIVGTNINYRKKTYNFESIDAMGHSQRKGDMDKVGEAIQLKENLVCGEQGRLIKQKKKVEQKQLRVHNASVKKRVSVLNNIGNEVLNVFSQGLERIVEQGESELQPSKSKKKKKRRANELLTTKQPKGINKKGPKKSKTFGTPATKVDAIPDALPVTPVIEVNETICGACNHCSMMNLVMMEHNHVMTYLKNDGYFTGKVCKGKCERSINDVAKQRGQEIYYCKIDFKKATLNDTADEENIQCNYIICDACRQEKIDQFDKENQVEGGGVVRSRRVRRPNQRY